MIGNVFILFLSLKLRRFFYSYIYLFFLTWLKS